MKVEMRNIERIQPFEGNPRKNDDAVAAVARSIEAYGFRQPVVVDSDGVIVVGHTRWKAAQQLGLEKIPVHVATDLTPEQARAYRIADNRTNEIAEWDSGLLSIELLSLKELGIDIDAIGFTNEELEALLAPPEMDGLCDPDQIPDVPDDPVTRPGDLYTLGEHRLLCGDATNEKDVKRLLDGCTPFIMVTDPPYGVEYDPTYRSSNRTGKVSNDDRADWSEAYRLFPGDVVYVWHGNLHVAEVVVGLDQQGLAPRAYIIWKKPHFAMGRGAYHWQHEPCWYAVRNGRKAKWKGDRTQSTVWEIDHVHPTLGTTDDGETKHGTQKPVECMARPIRNHGGPNDDVYDPFLGSGTSIIAAEKLGRRCYGLEIDPSYCDVIVQRWEQFTGGKAKRRRRRKQGKDRVVAAGDP